MEFNPLILEAHDSILFIDVHALQCHSKLAPGPLYGIHRIVSLTSVPNDPDAPPSVEALRSHDPAISRRSWAEAYPLLWEALHRLARRLLTGDSYEHDRQDLCAVAMQQFVRGLVEGSTESFNQISTWDDCLGMIRHILHLRVKDFFRAQARNREDSSEVLPETAVAAGGDNLTLSELLTLVDELDPPKPELLRDRFLDGYSTDEIAQRRQMNRNTVVSHFAQGLRYLRSRLEKLENPGGLLP